MPHAVNTTKAIADMTDVTGPQTARSGFDGVIQLRPVVATCTAKATQPVQAGQPSPGNPAADRIASAWNRTTGIDTAAAMRPASGKAPSNLPPWV